MSTVHAVLDYYEVLGVSRDADARTIKEAFRRLARRYHPDTSTEPDAEQRFREIAEAYGILSDPAKRASYDAGGTARLTGVSAADLWEDLDFGDIFGSAAPGFSGLFARLFGQAAGLARGADTHLELSVTLHEVLTGGNQQIAISRPGPCARCNGTGARRGTIPRPCPDCGGTGQRALTSRQGPLMVRHMVTCPACHGRGQVVTQACLACAGTGRARRLAAVTISIPRGVPEGAVLRLSGYGMSSPEPGGPPGDAYVTIRTGHDARFTRNGADLAHELHISVPDAVLGVVAAVPSLDGPVRLTIPPGTQSGTILRIPGAGLPRYRDHGRGSLNVVVRVTVPRRLTGPQRELYRRLRDAEAQARPSAPKPAARPRGWLHRLRKPV